MVYNVICVVSVGLSKLKAKEACDDDTTCK